MDQATRKLVADIDNYINNVRGGSRRPVSEEALNKLQAAVAEMRKSDKPAEMSPGQQAARKSAGSDAVAEQFSSRL